MLTRKKISEAILRIKNDKNIILSPSKEIVEKFYDIIDEDFVNPYQVDSGNYLMKLMLTDKDRLVNIAAFTYELYRNIYENPVNINEIDKTFFENSDYISVIRIMLSSEHLYDEFLLMNNIDLREFVQIVVFLNYKILTYKNIAELKKKFINV